MKIDGNELAILQNELDQQGFKDEALKIKLEFLRQVRESGDHCPCKEACRHHGNCFECVTIHRGHRDHLPMCLWDMVNERIAALSHITEGSLHAYEARVKAERAAAEVRRRGAGLHRRLRQLRRLRIKSHPKSARFRQSQRLTSVSLFFLYFFG